MLGITNVSNAPSIVLKDTVVSTWTSGSYNGYSYRCAIPITGVTENTIAEVTFSQAQAESGNYSSVCTTYDGGLYVYSKVNTQITIPSIIIHSIIESYYDMDNAPTQGSTRAVTSGGVYSALRGTYKTITLPSPFTTGWCHRFEILPGVYLYQISDAKASSTGDFVLDASVVPSHQGTRGALFNPDSRAITGLIFNTDSTGIKVRVLGSASDYMVGQVLVVTY